MPQELESAKYLQQASPEEMKAYEKRVAGSSTGRFAAKSLCYLVLWIALLGGGGFMVCNAIYQANEEKAHTGTGYGPAMSVLSFCMHLVHFDWDDRMDEYSETVWPEDPFEDSGEFADDAGWRARREMADQMIDERRQADALPHGSTAILPIDPPDSWSLVP